MELTIDEIKKYIKNWQLIRKDAHKVNFYLENVSSFSYKSSFSEEQNLHVYPGVCFTTNKLYMFLISAEADAREDYSNIIVSEISTGLGMEEPLPTRIAMERIENWKLHRNSWIAKQAGTEEGIFAAFNLPSDYMTKDAEYETFFSLEPDSRNVTGYVADLVTMRKNFYDVVRPVPPFPPESFTLLR